MSSDLKSRLAFIKGLELKALSGAPPFAAATEQGAVASASAVSFVGNIEGQMKVSRNNTFVIGR